MPPTKPQSSPQKKPLKKIRILQIKRTEQKSLIEEHFYLFLAIVFGFVTFLLWGFGLRPDESAIIGLWIAAILFVARQIKRYIKGEAETTQASKKGAKPKPVNGLPEKYTPPALPRVSKNFSPMPPAGDKRYPPPSPFIKPPK
jgi:hypothetical protein